MTRAGKTVFILFFLMVSFGAFAQSQTVGFASSYPVAMEGLPTASGESYASGELTACHSSLPFNSLVKVTNLKNNKTVIVRVNDRFPFRNSRLIDISKAAADQIELFADIAPRVSIEVVGTATPEMIAMAKKSTPAVANEIVSTTTVKPGKQAAVVKAKTEAKPKTTPVSTVATASVKTEVVANTTTTTTTTQVQPAIASVTAKTDNKVQSPGMLNFISFKMPVISFEKINELAAQSLNYISLSFFRKLY